jgi:prolyl-tRNA editing enzyme YbaK/EbsC (Cys-tRNA(Pro) deacylase)
MAGAEEVVELTSHPVGGVCPFGLPAALPIYCDISLRAFAEVVPAAGATNAAVRMETERLAELTGAEWVDVCQ